MHISFSSVRKAFRPSGKELSSSSFEMIQAVISFESLPEDLLYHIFSYLSVKDVVRLQRVSKTLKSTVLRDTTWYILYRTSSRPRIPALLSTHSASYLQSWLTSSEKFDRWCTNARTLNFGNKELPLPGVARRRTVELYPDASGNHTPYGLVFSRWLVVTSICSSEAPVRCFDLDAEKGNDPAEEAPLQLYAKHSTVLYTTSGMIFDLRCVQSTRMNGERVAFVILVENFFALKVFQFQVSSRGSQPHVTLQEVFTRHDMHLSSLREVSLGPRLIAIKYARGGTFRSPGPKSDHILCLDIETFTTFTVTHDDTASPSPVESMLSCTSHLLLLRASSTHTLVEAYEIPPSVPNEPYECKIQSPVDNLNPNTSAGRLQRSHEGVVGSKLSNVVIVHDPMFPYTCPRSAGEGGYHDDEGATITASFHNRTDDQKTFLGLVRLTLLPRDSPSTGGIATRILGSYIHPADPSPPTVVMDSSFNGSTKGFVFYPEEVTETSIMPRFRVRAALSVRSPQPPEAEFISVMLGEGTGERLKKRREITSLVRTTAASLRYTDFASGDEDTLEEAQAARKARATIRVVPCPLPVDGISARDILFDGCTGRMVCKRPVRVAHRWMKRIEVWDIV
ncbi:hypothetical protein DFH29DRAFT_914655 [Suillus ampliporus]|nr:hypothetical protein DFH29DRAFT_914655 [Suillus ampliporus]